jgi:hypothetical protein
LNGLEIDDGSDWNGILEFDEKEKDKGGDEGGGG